MGKKIDLNSPRSSSSGSHHRRANHNFSHPLSRIQNNPNQNLEDNPNASNENTNNSTGPSQLQKKGMEAGLRAAGVPKGVARFAAKRIRNYELPNKVKATITFPKKSQLIVIMLMIAIPLLIVLALFVTLFSEEDSTSEFGLAGYPYYDNACKSVKVGDQIMDIDDYIPGVIAAEVPGFSEETLKTFAIAARTYLISNGTRVGDDSDSCYYQVRATDDTFQVYKPDSINETYIKAAQDTKGLIITVNGTISPAFYDASCIYTAAEAKQESPEQNFSDDNIYIKYGSVTIGGNNYQAIPKSVYSNVGTLSYWAQQASLYGACYHNHGWGMSQNGAYYLEKYQEYNWEEIINFYYQDEETIMSIYPSYGTYSGEYPIDPDDELYKNLHFLAGDSVEDVVTSNGSTVQEFNTYLSESINSAGYGTRDATVTAAVTLIGSLAEMGYKVNYEWGGGHEGYFIGAKSTWGDLGNAYCTSHPQPSECYKIYRWKGLDCSGFVKWVIYNGTGKQVSIDDLFGRTGIGPVKSLSSSQAVCQPGDALYSSGHVVFVVGIDESTHNYIVAEAAGYAGYGISPQSDASNYGGVKLSHYGFAKSGYKCLDLSNLY